MVQQPQKKSDGIRSKARPAPVRAASQDQKVSPAMHKSAEIGNEVLLVSKDTLKEPQRDIEAEERATHEANIPPAKNQFFSRMASSLPLKDKFPVRSWQPTFLGDATHEDKTPRRGWRRWGMLTGAVAMVAIFILVSTSFARLTVTIKPHVEEVAVENLAALFDVSVSKALLTQKVIPAQELTFSRTASKEFSATGRERVEERARGKARIFNAFSSASQPLVAGTRFMAPSGAIYRIQKPVIVPGAKIEQGKINPQSIEVELFSDAPGEAANISGEITLKIPGFKGGPRYEGFYAVSAQGFSGGFQGEATVVSKDDVRMAEEQVSKAVFEEIEAEMARSVPSGLSMLKELREIRMIKVEAPRAGTRQDRFSASASAVGNALVFREEDAIALVRSIALAGKDDQEFVEGSARLSYRVKSIDFEKGRVDAAISGSIKSKTLILQQELASLIGGKKEGSAIELLKARRELANFNLSFFPPWRSKAPNDPDKIRFRVEGP